MKKCSLAVLFSILVGLAACGQNGEPDVTTDVDEDKVEEAVESEASSEDELLEVTVLLDWIINTNHTGLYVAQDQGFFEEEGLDLTIIESATEGVMQVVAAGQADFGIASQNELTMARAQDIPVVSIAAIIQEHTSGFASLADKGITSPEDFAGKTYGGWGSPMEEAILNYVLEASDVGTTEVENVTVGSSDFFVNAKREIDFQWIYYGWTGVESEVREEEINMIYLTDIDPIFEYYAPILISSESVINEQPELVEKFLRAVSKGYEFSIEHPEEAADILIAVAPETDAELIKASQEWLSTRYQGNATQWGIQEEDIWTTFSAWMLETGLIEKEVTSEEAMTNKFLP
ncbi:ABC transporter substrate-binding protein [Bacillus solitudinis]|uniref:ABC transporter substrate-binding protein n=1 Tax=Bacillus solitudinis TaxID=2014074 RepID=UPI000C24425B|nr:ABC transporter substrate-binding protein [Bacillus solitudinis]